MRCHCDHSTHEHVEHQHAHPSEPTGAQRCQHVHCSAVCCASDAVSTGRSQCQCDHHSPPQQSGPSAFQVRVHGAIGGGPPHFSMSPCRTSAQTVASADIRKTASALETCAALCRFLT
ncbi:hypothetical protein DSM3645_02173 [Blastopirellula marina DSM 3645]|uniref:Uncharacterized protein n=1 Tax=Blastopirellula marina DSM 3645 TaxID=314230 RepID=A3ZV98_9BACT|nr:hypothetical protein DSM3645_02173 [Blastopirellula marina DSM 3645]